MGQILTITGYAEAGRRTLVRHIIKKHPGARLMTSTTTKHPSKRDMKGMYHHVTEVQFTALEWMGSLLWGVLYHGLRDQGSRYGTSREVIDQLLDEEGALGILLPTPEAVVSLRGYLKSKGREDALVPVFLVAPPEDIHRRRLRSREVSEGVITRALHKAKDWHGRALKAKKDGTVPYHFIANDGRVLPTVREVLKLLK